MKQFDRNAKVLDSLRQLDLVQYLKGLGYEPAAVRKNNMEYWYLSPLRNEATASFKVNRRMNKWFDFGLHQGGNTVDFCLVYHQCSIPELIEKLGGGSFLQQHPDIIPIHPNIHVKNDSKISVVSTEPLSANTLRNYLIERLIPFQIAEQFCCQVSYELNGKPCYGIGFKNDSGGWEIRSKLFKHSSSPKDITTLNNGASSVQVFEGFMDFLSYRVLHQKEDIKTHDFIVLNGAGLFEKARPFLEQHKEIGLWLDNDSTGKSLVKSVLSLDKGYVDESGRYDKYKDLNDYLTGRLLGLKQQLNQRIS